MSMMRFRLRATEWVTSRSRSKSKYLHVQAGVSGAGGEGELTDLVQPVANGRSLACASWGAHAKGWDFDSVQELGLSAAYPCIPEIVTREAGRQEGRFKNRSKTGCTWM